MNKKIDGHCTAGEQPSFSNARSEQNQTDSRQCNDVRGSRYSCPQSHQCSNIQVEVPDKAFWQRIPLPLSNQLQDAEDQYILELPLKIRKQKHLQVHAEGDNLVIRGLRLPTLEEAAELQAWVQREHSSRTVMNAAESRHCIEGLYAKYGRNRFGAFEKKVPIPSDVNRAGIRVTRHDDRISARFPKCSQQQR